ncbi:heme exporter protein CcmB [Nereida sp.]|uniref:heme exporter protein CcmB n=1 Tax=Nereida sp. TaxID=2736090 RepID=UPI003F695EBB
MKALLLRDLRLATRAGGGFGLGLAFFLILATLIPFGVGPQPDVLASIAPGVLWVGALLSCLLSLERIFALDFEDGALDLMASSPLPLEGIVAAKSLAHWLTTGLPLVVAAPLLGLMLNLPSQSYGWLLISLLIGTPALSVIGAFGAALTVGLKRGGLLISLLVLPLYVPTLIFGADVVRRAGQGLDASVPTFMLAGLTLGAVASMPFASAAALRAGLKGS